VIIFIKSFFYKLYNRFKNLQGSPISLAKGTAIGVFVGVIPVVPIKNLLILFFTLITRSNILASVTICALISNPFTYLFQYYICWVVGDLFLPQRAIALKIRYLIDMIKQSSFSESCSFVLHMGIDTIIVLLVGGIVIAIPISILSYMFAIRYFNKKS